MPNYYADAKTGITVRILKAVPQKGSGLVYVRMHNGGSRTFQPDSTVQFYVASFVEPSAGGTTGTCDSSSSPGPGLDFQSIPKGATRTGWLRCDYPSSAHIFAVFWLNHEVGAFRTGVGT